MFALALVSAFQIFLTSFVRTRLTTHVRACLSQDWLRTQTVKQTALDIKDLKNI